jgi:nucleoside-diphosphate-sugar epimerase
MHETAPAPLAAFRIANTDGTFRLAKEAEAAGVKRFVFLSTIGVNGDNSGLTPYREESVPSPHNAYAVSKYEAEERLAELAAESGMELVVLRAPLVYGPGNPGNFLSLLRAVSSGIPLPFAAITNRRSFLYVENLVDALETCAIHPAAKGAFLVCDGEDLSTADLIRRIATALDVPARLFPCPLALLKIAGTLAGKAGAVRQITNSLQVDNAKIREKLNWTPPYTVDEGLLKTAQWFKQVQKNT